MKTSAVDKTALSQSRSVDIGHESTNRVKVSIDNKGKDKIRASAMLKQIKKPEDMIDYKSFISSDRQSFVS